MKKIALTLFFLMSSMLKGMVGEKNIVQIQQAHKNAVTLIEKLNKEKTLEEQEFHDLMRHISVSTQHPEMLHKVISTEPHTKNTLNRLLFFTTNYYFYREEDIKPVKKTLEDDFHKKENSSLYAEKNNNTFCSIKLLLQAGASPFALFSDLPEKGFNSLYGTVHRLKQELAQNAAEDIHKQIDTLLELFATREKNTSPMQQVVREVLAKLANIPSFGKDDDRNSLSTTDIDFYQFYQKLYNLINYPTPLEETMSCEGPLPDKVLQKLFDVTIRLYLTSFMEKSKKEALTIIKKISPQEEQYFPPCYDFSFCDNHKVLQTLRQLYPYYTTQLPHLKAKAENLKTSLKCGNHFILKLLANFYTTTSAQSIFKEYGFMFNELETKTPEKIRTLCNSIRGLNKQTKIVLAGHKKLLTIFEKTC